MTLEYASPCKHTNIKLGMFIKNYNAVLKIPSPVVYVNMFM